MSYIDKDELILDLAKTQLHVSGLRFGKTILVDFANRMRESLISVIQNAPTSDVTPIRHGAWITIGKTKHGSPIRICSYCERQRTGTPKSAYCPDCGARMDLTGYKVDDQIVIEGFAI